MGGGGFTMRQSTAALDELVLRLTGKPVPRLCFLPTASGDPREQVTRFHERFAALPCEPSVLSLSHLGRDRVDPVSLLLAQDVIYVGGGSLRNMLAIGREHRVDRAMRTCLARGRRGGRAERRGDELVSGRRDDERGHAPAGPCAAGPPGRRRRGARARAAGQLAGRRRWD